MPRKASTPRRAIPASRSSQERYRALFETMTTGAVFQDRKGRIVSANPAAEQILGLSVDQMVGRTSTDPRWKAVREDGSPFPGDEHPAMIALRTGKPVHDVVMGVFHPHRKEQRWIRIDAIPLRMPQRKKPHQVYTTFIDITEKHKAEDAVRSILRGTASTTGESFFRALVSELASALGMRYAFVGRLLEKTPERVRTVALCDAQTMVDNIEYDLADTPCEQVVGQQLRFYPRNVQRRFPRDPLLKGMGVRSYLGVPLFSSSREPLGILVAMHDQPVKDTALARDLMTIFAARASAELERLQAERTLRLTQHAMDHSQDAIAWSGPDAHFLYVNEATCRTLGYTRDELLKMSVPDVDAQMEKGTAPDYWNYIRQHRTHTFETEHRRKDGRLIPVEIAVSYLEHEGQEFFVANARDIGERRKMEAERDRLFSLSMDMLCVAGFDGHFKQLNPAWQETLGWSTEELLAKPWLDFVHPDDREVTVRAGDELQRGRPVHSFENRYVCKDGSYRWLSWNSFPLPDEERIFAVVRDVTERKRTEKELALISGRQDAILASVPDIIAEVDEQKVYTWMNRAGLEFFGDEAVGHEASCYFEGQQETYGAVQPLFNGHDDVIYVESWQRRKDGEKRLLAWWCRVLKDAHGNMKGALSTARDITEQKRAEQELLRRSEELARVNNALRESEERFRTLVESCPTGVWQDDLNHQTIYVNPAMRQMLELAPGEDIAGQDWQPFFTPESRERIAVEHASRLEGRASTYEVEIIGRCGTRRSVAVSGAPLAPAEGKFRGTIASFLDITERKRAEEAVRRSEERFHTIFDSLNDAVFVHDLETGAIVDVNKRVSELLGCAPLDARNLTVGEFSLGTPPYDQAHALEWIHKAATAEPQRFDWHARSLDGRLFWAEVNMRRVHIAGHDRVLVVARDISERKHMEEALRQSEERFRSIVETTSDWIWEIDAAGVYTYSNPRVTALTGFRPEEIVGKHLLDLMPTEEAERLRPLVDRSLERPEPLLNLQSACVHKGGGTIVLETNAVPILDDSGRLLGYRGIDRDITQRKQAEAALRESEMKYRAVVETTNTGFVILDEAGRVCDANAEFVRLTGRDSLDDIRGHVVTEWTASHDLERNAIEIQRCLEAGFVRQLEIDYVGPSGHVVPVEVNATAVVTGEGTRIISICRDITERKRLQAAIEGDRAFLRQVIDAAPGFICVKDCDSRFILANKALAEAYGTTVENLIGKSDADFNPHAEEVAKFNRDDRQVISTREPLSIPEEPITFSDGRVHWLTTTKVPLINPDGSCTQLLATTTDITDRKHMEEALRENEATLGSIFKAAPVGIGLVSNRVLLRANDHLCQMVGYSADELVGKSARMLYPSDEDFEYVGREKYRQISEHGTGTVETRWRHKNGSVIDVILSSTPLDTNDLSAGVTFTALDITERKRAEAALRESETRLTALFRAITDAVYVHEIAAEGGPGRIIEVNDVACRMLGYTREEILGMAISDIDAPESSVDVKAVIEQLKAGQDLLFQQSHAAKDGRRIPVEIHACVYDLRGTPVILSTVRDIAERKKAEEERERLLRELEAKNKEMESLIYVASHDLRSPLVNILGFGLELEKACEKLMDSLGGGQAAEEIRERVSPILQGAIPTALGFIKASGAKMDVLIDGLLRVSRTGRVTLHIRPLDMDQEMKAIVDGMRFQMQQASAIVEVDPLPACRADSDQLNQVFTNLIDNALKYRDPERPLVLRISGRLKEQEAIYCVQDTGRGIPPAHQKRIWDLFHRLDPQEDVPGEGLGLTLVRRIVERHGGRVWVESHPGHGSRFYVALPAVLQ